MDERRCWTDVVSTPWGWVAASYSEKGLRGIVLPCRDRERALRLIGSAFETCREGTPWPEWRDEMRRYFSGEETSLRLPLDLPCPGGFTARVREVVRSIPYGGRKTYGEVARRAGSPGAARAVGAVMARNPVPLCIPCHRVVASTGEGGFSAEGGEVMKARLLELERGRGR